MKQSCEVEKTKLTNQIESHECYHVTHAGVRMRSVEPIEATRVKSQSHTDEGIVKN